MAGIAPPPDQPGAVDSYATRDDVPNDLDPGTVVYVESDHKLYYENGA